MSFDLKTLYGLLPAFYRLRDTQYGINTLTAEEKARLKTLTGSDHTFPEDEIYGPLKSLLALLAEQIAILEENMEQLYDDQFIETCAEWVIPYIGKLVGASELHAVPAMHYSRRAEVAHTIGYRRRKGTASVIEQLARDVTGWNASVTEYFRLLSTTQYMNHLRPENRTTVSVRKTGLSGLENTPFDTATRSADVRNIGNNRGKYNIPNIGIFLWRLGSYRSTQSPAYKVDDRRYTFHPLGLNEPIYRQPATEDEIAHLARPENVAMPISREEFWNNKPAFYGLDKSLLIYRNGVPLLPGDEGPDDPWRMITVCNLCDIADEDGNVTGWAHMPQESVAIDPELGRIAFPASQPPPDAVHVSYHYGFSSGMGGGEYGRIPEISANRQKIVKVRSGTGTIQDALNMVAESGGIVEIEDNEYHFEAPFIRVAEGKTIELRAAPKFRPVLVPPHEIKVVGGAFSTVILDGLLISGSSLDLPEEMEGGIKNELQRLQISHCTLLPLSSPPIGDVAGQPVVPRVVVHSAGTRVEMDKSISGSFRVAEGAVVRITHSIADALDENEIVYAGLSGNDPGGALEVSYSTLIGKISTRVIQASDAILLAGEEEKEGWPHPVAARRLQEGCVRFSYVPPGSKVPRPYQCQPSIPGAAVRLRPVFTSLRYGDPGYGQLGIHCASEIREGADDQAEMGAFHDLFQPQRIRNLRNRLDEYLRFGLEAGIFFAS